MFKCAHISDIHFRSLKRHEEYKIVFSSLFDSLRKTKELDAIFIGGDIVHSKTQGITPELIDVLNWWFTSLSEIAPTYVILGNHDGLILNESRQDAITPIINALNNKNIYLYKKSGVYPLAENNTGLPINWCVFSCFDEKSWGLVKPVKDEINIACFHGAVTGSKTDVDWELEGEVKASFFDGFDFGFLGDIHKLQYLDFENRIAYPGSTIQQNYGEDIKKGYLLWEIRSKNDYSSKFVQIKNPYPYLTLDWKGTVEKTILFASKVKKGVRFRVRSNESISQAEIKLLHYYLKNDKEAKEIVYQINNSETSSVKRVENDNKTYNVRIKQDRISLINDYYEDIDQKTLEDLDSLFQKSLDKIPENLKDVYGQKWSINSLEFDNTFSYGKNNYIDFDKMSGIVGLFGNNRAGKSSIPGTLMYTLFNTTDRGAIKNQDIVNIRKGSCKAKANITIGTDQYQVIRETIKKTNKKNETSATTSLSLQCLTNDYNETEEQRRETEKILQKLIGNSDDFLYTSFASQGEINTFIKEKNSARKSILTKFLNLEIYDEIYKISREDYIVLKSILSTKSEKDWDSLTNLAASGIQENNEKILRLNEENSKLRRDLINLNIDLQGLKNNSKKHASGFDKVSAKKEKDHIKSKTDYLVKEKEDILTTISELNVSIEKINQFKNSFSVEDLKNEKSRLESLEEKLKGFKALFSENKQKKIRIENELKILEQVPCGDDYPTCKFIKKAHEEKGKIEEIKKESQFLESNILELKSIVSRLQEKQINQKIIKFESILQKEYKINIDKENAEIKLDLKNKEIEDINKRKEEIEKIIEELKNYDNDDILEKENEIKIKLDITQEKINKNEFEILKFNKSIFDLTKDIETFKTEKEEYYDLIQKFRLYDLFTSCVSKKGIPTMLINSFLPKINNEINNILNGVVSFKVYLEEEDKNNNLNVYIDYGDSKRIIECGSGMEKMISSLAIRVALVNISSLAKSDIFIIDEGFGALDDSNIESCSRLLKSLKKYFKTIMIISHVDSIKDIVDKNIEISVRGNDAYVRYE